MLIIIILANRNTGSFEFILGLLAFKVKKYNCAVPEKISK
ncbi:hypothetical protein BAOM_2610 [Peribacillus asahii]|uniref:Uncharacterized protein n=1 Tax=Peribacillus asahii TaxID=228899 RepID=A0A3Q9RNE6_9BACI|nr:hypothetical protein BAOM_2610 [Peribacillus asahii]